MYKVALTDVTSTVNNGDLANTNNADRFPEAQIGLPPRDTTGGGAAKMCERAQRETTIENIIKFS
jgi:hypothetical protein